LKEWLVPVLENVRFKRFAYCTVSNIARLTIF
jgi:hypothetical protein